MRSMTRTFSGLTLILAVGIAGAHQPGGEVIPPKKSALEEALEQALKNNPDLRVAASKLALAEAELSRTRLQITQKVAAAYAETLSERAVLEEMERQLARIRNIHKTGAASAEELSKAELQLAERKAKLGAAQRELDNLQGKGIKEERVSRAQRTDMAEFYDRTGHPEAANFYRGAGQDVRAFAGSGVRGFDLFSVKSDATGKLRQSLQKKATLTVKKVSLIDYLALVRKAAGGINVHANTKGEAWKETIDTDFEDVTIGGMLQFLEDNLAGHAIIVREYGLLIVPKEKVPPAALTLTAFLALGSKQEKPKANLTRDPVEGKITKVDGKGLYLISIGSKAGLIKGQRLEVYSSSPTPKYLGRLVVTEVEEDAAVCKTADKMHGNPMVGDMVATKLAGK